MNRIRRGVWLALLVPVLALVGCAGLQPGPRQVDISERRLVAAVAQSFPVQKRYGELFELKFSDPAVRLMPEENRIGTRLNFSASTLLNPGRPWTGQMALSYGLRFEASDLTVRLDAVRLDSVDMAGVPSAYAQALRGAGAQLTEGLMQNMVVHRFKPEDLRTVEGMGYQPGALKVVPGGLRLQLDPVQR